MVISGVMLISQSGSGQQSGHDNYFSANVPSNNQEKSNDFSCSDRSYRMTNFTLHNLDYNISTSRGGAASAINYANNFTGAYYVQNNGTLVAQNFISGRNRYLAKSPLLYLRYDYLDYNGEYFGEMPYYNASNILKWIFIYGIDPENYFEMWGYNLVNSTIINYTENNLPMPAQSNTNFQLTYVGHGNFIGIGGGESDYYLWNIYKKELVHSGLDPFHDVEANNIYYISQYDEFVNVWADGTSTDNIQFASIGSNGEILSVKTLATNESYEINGVFDIIVDVRTCDVWINDGAANYGLIVILHWTGSTFMLLSTTYTSSDKVNQFNNYALENNYIPIVTSSGYIQSGNGGWGSPRQFFINEFSCSSINITGLSGNDINWARGLDYGNGAPVGIDLPEINGEYLNSAYYGMWLNTTSPVPHVFYAWNSSEPESLSSYVNEKRPNVFYVNIHESGLPAGNSWSYTFNGTLYTLKNTSYTYALPNGNYSLKVDASTGYNMSYPETVTVDDHSIVVNVEFSVRSYKIAFLDNGIASVTWGITMNGSRFSATSGSVILHLKDGSYSFRVFYPRLLYDSNLTGGLLNVSGENLTFYISFKYVAHDITFNEIGLPDKMHWSMIINGTSYTSNSSDGNGIIFTARNGSYVGQINSASGINPVNRTFNFTVIGNEQFIVKYYIALTFIISGYNGSWHIKVNGKVYFSNTSSISVVVVPGTVNFIIGNVSGYNIAPKTSVNSYTENQTILISFAVRPPSIASRLLSSPLIFLDILVFLVALLSLIYLRLRSGR